MLNPAFIRKEGTFEIHAMLAGKAGLGPAARSASGSPLGTAVTRDISLGIYKTRKRFI
jgi:hypothetical protein